MVESESQYSHFKLPLITRPILFPTLKVDLNEIILTYLVALFVANHSLCIHQVHSRPCPQEVLAMAFWSAGHGRDAPEYKYRDRGSEDSSLHFDSHTFTNRNRRSSRFSISSVAHLLNPTNKDLKLQVPPISPAEPEVHSPSIPNSPPPPYYGPFFTERKRKFSIMGCGASSPRPKKDMSFHVDQPVYHHVPGSLDANGREIKRSYQQRPTTNRTTHLGLELESNQYQIGTWVGPAMKQGAKGKRPTARRLARPQFS